jgi:hypothetical protein
MTQLRSGNWDRVPSQEGFTTKTRKAQGDARGGCGCGKRGDMGLGEQDGDVDGDMWGDARAALRAEPWSARLTRHRGAHGAHHCTAGYRRFQSQSFGLCRRDVQDGLGPVLRRPKLTPHRPFLCRDRDRRGNAGVKNAGCRPRLATAMLRSISGPPGLVTCKLHYRTAFDFLGLDFGIRGFGSWLLAYGF